MMLRTPITSRRRVCFLFFVLTCVIDYLQNLVGHRGDLLRAHIEANSIGVAVPDMYNDNLQAALIDKKGVIFMDLQSITSTVYRWCVETDAYFYISQEKLADLPGLWYTSKRLGKELNEAMDMK